MILGIMTYGQPIAYTYRADVYCPGCILEVLHLGERGQAPVQSVESELDAIASERGIDRYDEWSFDSGEFPKVVFDAEEDEHCGQCGGVID